MSDENRSVVVIGAGGHAAVVIATLDDMGRNVIGVFDDDPAMVGTQVLDRKVQALDSLVQSAEIVGVIGVGRNEERHGLASRFPWIRWLPVVHPTAYVHRSAQIEPGAVVFAGTVVQPRCVVGAHAVVNTGSTIDHDCQVGLFAHVAPGNNLAGNVKVGQGALLGIGATVIPGVHIGDWATVGAGAVVIHDVPARTTVTGVPAKEKV